MATIHFAVNGRPYTVDADPQTSLLTVLRENLDLGSVWSLHRPDRWKGPPVLHHPSRSRWPKTNYNH